ncbi:MAG: MMPL family transporter [Verrucomicrobiae bacterium]|nr:MMPL family transporter [Verrucomicrobiae bacterium]
MSSPEGVRFRFLRGAALGVTRFAWPIVLLAFALAAAAVWITVKKLAFTSNPNDLLESSAGYHRLYLDYTREFRSEEDYILVVAGPRFEENRDCVNFLAERLGARADLFPKIFYRIDFGDLLDRGLLFLETGQLEEIEKEMAKQIGSSLGAMGKQRTVDLTGLLAEAAGRLDPKNLRKNKDEEGLDRFADEFVRSLEALADRLEGKKALKPVSFGNFLAEKAEFADMQKQQAVNEYIAFEDGKILLVMVPSPNAEASFGGHDAAIKPLREILAAARTKFPGLEIGLTGEPALSEDESIASTHDTTVASAVTFLLIAGLFWFSYREFSRPALAITVLLLAVAWTLGFTTLGVGRLNILSITFIPMILGLGIDFGIQILGRYEEELPRAPDSVAAIVNTLGHTGNAILTGGSTTALAFYTMCFNQFTGLREMGLISGTGILLCMAANLVVLPAMLHLRDRKGWATRRVPASQQYEKHHLFDRIVLDHSNAVIVLAAAVTVIALTALPFTRFDYNLLKLQNPTLESVKFERKLIDSKGSHSIIFAASLCKDLAEATARAERFRMQPSVKDVLSLTEIVPRDQERKLEIIQRIKGHLESVRIPKKGDRIDVAENIRVIRQLRVNCEKTWKKARTWGSRAQREGADEFFGKLTRAMDRALPVLEKMDQARAEKILGAYQSQLFGELRESLEFLKHQKADRPITVDDLPKSMKDQFIGRTGRILLQIYPREDIWDREPLDRFVHDLRRVDSDVTGTPVQNFEYIELLKTSYEQAALYALGMIVFLVFLHFRSVRDSPITLLPLFLGILWTVGLMPLVNLPFNPANIVTLPLIIGIGVAYGVYAVDRYRENRSPAIFSTSTGKAILLSAFTTIFGFGTLAFASHRGIASLGTLMTIGVALCMVTSLYVCPAVLKALGRRSMEIRE